MVSFGGGRYGIQLDIRYAAGALYLFRGPLVAGTYDVLADATHVIHAETAMTYMTSSLGAGDLDGDGFDDIVAHSPLATVSGKSRQNAKCLAGKAATNCL